MTKNQFDQCWIEKKKSGNLQKSPELKKTKIVLLANGLKCPPSMENAQNEFHHSELSLNYFG